jgi:hypothetical protein
VTFKSAVEATPAIQAGYCKGLNALRAVDRRHVQAEVPEKLTGSVDVDTALKQAFPNDSRWDYAIGHQPANLKEEVVHWVEVHPASDGQVKVVLAKLRWLQQWLRTAAPKLNAMRREFVWVSSGKTSFTLSSTQQKQFAQLGLRHKGRVYSIANDAGV